MTKKTRDGGEPRRRKIAERRPHSHDKSDVSCHNRAQRCFSNSRCILVRTGSFTSPGPEVHRAAAVFISPLHLAVVLRAKLEGAIACVKMQLMPAMLEQMHLEPRDTPLEIMVHARMAKASGSLDTFSPKSSVKKRNVSPKAKAGSAETKRSSKRTACPAQWCAFFLAKACTG
eukprot:CAMPEP_0115550480 /NCGR_PEP_ID=MMETSP0271-20121206/95243_1 /TAXON_ID=71861 /ORGANISM="Scrippsiella trochoidea, Strain CCMP3099" /LENGTH=172 /DNA_ID=CAMNT_0002984063 /DNA_START=220 /DNA_END=738 /DNA_ORIENTATION=+